MAEPNENAEPSAGAENSTTEENIVDLGAAQQSAVPPAVVEEVDAQATPPAGDAPPAGEATAAPAIGTQEWMDAPERTLQELRDYLEGRLTPEAEEAAAAAGDDADADAEPDADTDAAGEADATTTVPDVNLTEDLSDELFDAEVEKYLAAVELTPEMQMILDRKDKQIEAARTSALDESVTEHMEAFDQLVSFRKDEELGAYVADTSGIIALLQKKYPKELPQVVEDLALLPSQKYQGHTMFQEYLRDGFDLDAPAMEGLQQFLDNKGRVPTLQFVPEGIDPKAAEAFWRNPEREAIMTQLERVEFALRKDPDATAKEKEDAKIVLSNINQNLRLLQQGLDAQAQALAAKDKARTDAVLSVQNEAVDAFVVTTRSILADVAVEATKGLDSIMDPAGSKLMGTAIGALIDQAFSDNDGYAEAARKDLADQGVTVDWKKAYSLRDRLFESEAKIIAMTKAGANQRAIDIELKAKDGIVKEMRGLAREAGGKINQKAIASAGSKLQKKVEGAPKIAAVRAKAAGAGANTPKGGERPNFDKMSRDQIRDWMKNNPLEAAVRGDLSGYRG